MDTITESAAPRRSRGELRLARHRRCAGVLLILFAVVLAAASLIAKDRTFSENENRSLAQRPALTLQSVTDGSFFAEYSDYLADQFWGRDRWISLDTLGVRLLGRHDVNGVFLGKDGYLLSDPEIPDETMLAEKAAAVNAFQARHADLNVMLMLAPGAASVLTDKLPGNAPVRDQLDDIAAIRSALSPDIRFLDAGAALTAHAGEEIYYRTDHHWTSLGAYYVFSAAADALAPDGVIPTFDVLTVSDTFQGTLASKTGIHGVRDRIDVYIPQDTDVEYYVNYPDSQTRVTSVFQSAALEEKDQYTVFLGGNHPLTEIWTTANNGRSLLVFKDSYANCFMQFLTTCYDRIVLIDPRYYYGDVSTVMTAYDITDVLFLYSADTWMTDTTLTDALATG